MTEGEERPDIPKIVATVGVKIPMLTIRVGVDYLRLRRKARKASEAFMEQLEREGVPQEFARQLGEEYGSEFSIRKLLDLRGGGFFRGLS